MAKLSATLIAAAMLAATLAGCGQASLNPRAQQLAAAQVAAKASLSTVRNEIKDALEDGPGANKWYEIRKVDAKATEKRNVFAFKAWGDRMEDGDRTAVLITGTYDAKTQEIDDLDEEEDG